MLIAQQRKTLLDLIQTAIVRSAADITTHPSPYTLMTELFDLRALYDEVKEIQVVEELVPPSAPSPAPQSDERRFESDSDFQF